MKLMSIIALVLQVGSALQLFPLCFFSKCAFSRGVKHDQWSDSEVSLSPADV
jgi:hypothetical protein